MWRASLLLGVTALGGCGSGPMSETHSDAGVHQAPISIISTKVGFPPASIALDFGGDVVAAHADHPILSVLDGMSLGLAGDIAVPGAPDPWVAPQLHVGAEGQGYLFATSGEFFQVNMSTEAVSVLVDAGADIVAWAPRLDVAGVAFADSAGAVHRVTSTGVEDLTVPASDAGEVVEAVAATLDGHLLVLTSIAGACTTLRADPMVSGAPVSGSFGSSPCRLGLATGAGAWVWVVGQVDGGAQVSPLRTSALGTAGAVTTVEGIAPTAIVVSADGSEVALLGTGPTYTVARAETANILSFDTPGDQGAWRVATPSEVPSASGGLFDDTGALYVADPSSMSIEIVQ